MMRFFFLFLLISVASATHFGGFSLESTQGSTGLVVFQTEVWACSVASIVFGTPTSDGHAFAQGYAYATNNNGESIGCHGVASADVDFMLQPGETKVYSDSNGNKLQDLVAFGPRWAQLSRSYTVSEVDGTSPVRYNYESAARITTLMDDNANTEWNIEGFAGIAGFDRSPYMLNPARIFLQADQPWEFTVPAYAGYEMYCGINGDLGGLNTAKPDGMSFDADTGTISWTPTQTGVYAVMFSFVAKDDIKMKTSWEVQFQVETSLIPAPTVNVGTNGNGETILTVTKDCESDYGVSYCHIFASASDGVIEPLDGFCMQDNSSCTRQFRFNPPAGVDDFLATPCFYATQPPPPLNVTTESMQPGIDQWSSMECVSVEVGNPENLWVKPPVSEDGFLVLKSCMGCETDCGAPHRGECDEELCACVCRHPFTSEGREVDDCYDVEEDC